MIYIFPTFLLLLSVSELYLLFSWKDRVLNSILHKERKQTVFVLRTEAVFVRKLLEGSKNLIHGFITCGIVRKFKGFAISRHSVK